ncbi:MAG: MFS transporter, partial [Pseudomonadota bacterium]
TLHAWVGLAMSFVVVGAAGLLAVAVMVINYRRLNQHVRRDGSREPTANDGIALLKSKPVVLCFVFQIAHSMAAGGIRSFGIVALAGIYGFAADDPSYALLGMGLTAYLVSGSFGNLLSGALIDRTGQSQLIFTVSILCIFAIVLAIGWWSFPIALVIVLLTIAGTLQGSLLPARDVLIRAISPPGQIGKVFGFTSSGLSLGNAVTPPLFGWVIDNGDPAWVFYTSALFILFALATFTETSRQAR